LTPRGLDVPGCLRSLAKHTGGFHHDVYPQLAPGQFGRVTLGKHLNFLTIDDQIASPDLHLARKTAIVRVVFQQLSIGLRVEEVVDSYHLDGFRIVLSYSLEDLTSNATESVDTDFDSHLYIPP
jgi:hypothetical protein